MFSIMKIFYGETDDEREHRNMLARQRYAEKKEEKVKEDARRERRNVANRQRYAEKKKEENKIKPIAAKTRRETHVKVDLRRNTTRIISRWI